MLPKTAQPASRRARCDAIGNSRPASHDGAQGRRRPPGARPRGSVALRHRVERRAVVTMLKTTPQLGDVPGEHTREALRDQSVCLRSSSVGSVTWCPGGSGGDPDAIYRGVTQRLVRSPAHCGVGYPRGVGSIPVRSQHVGMDEALEITLLILAKEPTPPRCRPPVARRDCGDTQGHRRGGDPVDRPTPPCCG